MIGLRDHFSREADTRCISTIGITELLIGAEKSNRPAETRRKIDRFTARLVVLPVDNARAQRFRYCIANQFLNGLPPKYPGIDHCQAPPNAPFSAPAAGATSGAA